MNERFFNVEDPKKLMAQKRSIEFCFSVVATRFQEVIH